MTDPLRARLSTAQPLLGLAATVTSSVVLVRTHFYPVRMAGLVRWASDGNGKASAGKY
jgi:hypothetical protein